MLDKTTTRRKKNPGQNRRPSRPGFRCLQCKKPLTRKERGPIPTYCSDACRKAHSRKTARDDLRNSWFTPADIIEAARGAMGGIDLDPASCAEANEVVQATAFYTLKDNGLTKPWTGKIWCNPPYQGYTRLFVEKLAEEVAAGRVTQACLLVSLAHLSTHWFHEAATFPYLLCTPKGRLKFRQPGGTPSTGPSGSVILAVGADPEHFRAAFEKIGRIGP